jgi:hypothetical protein
MLNGLHVDFNKTHGLICKEAMSHAIWTRLICLKHRNSFVKATL